METNTQIQAPVEPTVTKAEAQRNYWATMTPEERTAEMKRRMANRKAPKKHGKAGWVFGTPKSGVGATLHQDFAIASESSPSSITIPAAIGCVVTRHSNLISIRQEQDFRGAQCQVIDLHLAEAKLVAGALLNFCGRQS